MRNKIILATLVALTFALAVYIGVRGVIAGSGAGNAAAAEAARKKAFEEAQAKGNLSLYPAKYGRAVPGATAAEGKGGP